MTENILVGVAWPFPNGSLHLGQIVGAYLPADIFARYQRLAGNRVIMVSGSDQNGTPIVMLAEARGVTPQDIVSQYHNEYLDCWQRLGISWDCYTSTGTQNHIETAQEIFTKLFEKGDLYLETMEQTYCVEEGRFLPDRYVEGTCPFCGFDGARGDQCDNCGRSLDPVDLINPRCRHDGSTPERRPTEHFFLRLSAYNDQVKEWLSTGKDHWRRSVTSFSMGVLNEGLKDRAITRDLEWGVPIPLPGYDTKRIYVWFENVIGYLSAAKEWARKAGTPEAWKDFWLDPAAKIYYFIGKDNIWFHTLSWPAMVMMYDGGLNQPYDVPANQYLNFGGWKASTSRGTAPFLPDYLERYDADALRFYLAAVMPESSDSEFSEDDLVRRNNEELVSTWGNLVNRVLTMTYRNFDGQVPDPGELKLADSELLEQGQTALASIGESLNACRFREALRAALSYAQDTNRYLNQEEPWQTMKTDKQAAARALYTALGAIEVLKVAFDPFVPFSCQKLHEMLGHGGTIEDEGWKAALPVVGAALQQPVALFKKLEPPAAVEAVEPVIELFDSHAHIQEPEFVNDLDITILNARSAGVACMVLPGEDLTTSQRVSVICEQFAGIFGAAGYHPHEASRLTPESLAGVEKLLSHPKMVAVGEIGIDFFRDHSPRDVQIDAFMAQLDVARRHTMPVIVHCRDAWDALDETLAPWARESAAAYRGLPLGVLHYYSSDLETAQRYIELGFMISIHTSVTHPKLTLSREVAAVLPLESLVIETDSPYGAPQAYRGKRNEPAFVLEAAKKIAEVRGASLEVVAAATTANAKRLFRIGTTAPGAKASTAEAAR